jgi:hypothetical protein
MAAFRVHELEGSRRSLIEVMRLIESTYVGVGEELSTCEMDFLLDLRLREIVQAHTSNPLLVL